MYTISTLTQNLPSRINSSSVCSSINRSTILQKLYEIVIDLGTKHSEWFLIYFHSIALRIYTLTFSPDSITASHLPISRLLFATQLPCRYIPTKQIQPFPKLQKNRSLIRRMERPQYTKPDIPNVIPPNL